jgi:hypothetical protein
VDYDYRLPGTDEPVITVRRSAVGGVSVFADAVRLHGRRGRYEIADADGEPHAVTVTGAWTGLHVIADGVDTPLEPTAPTWLLVLTALPLILVIGGIVGGLLGAAGVGVNALIGRSGLRLPVRAVSMVAVLGLAALAWLGIGSALTTVPSPQTVYAVGACLTGVSSGADLVVKAPTVVDCSGQHDGEVVGTFKLDSGAVFPGETGLSQAAAQQCPALFAAYVGRDFSTSRLDILPVVPTQVAWDTGVREIACVAITTDGSKLTGSVRGTGQ